MTDLFQINLSAKQIHSYKLIRSKRAKYIRIKVTPEGEISVVLPRGIHEKHAHDFIYKKKTWISKTINNIPATQKITFPDQLDLKLLGEKWSIHYRPSSGIHGVKLRELSENTIELFGKIDDWAINKKLLNQWTKVKVRSRFKNMIESLAEEHGFHFNKLTIRSQKTRWGSCSSSKNINLNSKLIFMPEEIVKYVMIHELCHTIEMNHSSRFWELVEDCDVNYRDHRKKLKTLGKEVLL